MSAKDAILGRLRAAAPAQPLAPPQLGEHYRRHPGLQAGGDAERIDVFCRNARGWRAEVQVCSSADWASAVAQALAARGVRRVLLGRDTWIAAPLQAALAGTEVVWFDRALEEWKQELFDQVDASVTTVLAGLADTGTLVLVPDAREPRSMSLVPPLHIAVLQASRLHDTLPGAMQALQPQKAMPTNLVLVTGPSKTSDIQQTLAFGAHGPRELLIVLVDDTEPQKRSAA